MPYYTDPEFIGGGIGETPEGYERNDDQSVGPIALGFTLPYFGEEYTEFFINNNGNISFGESVSSFTPAPLDITTFAPIIAPYFADVDTQPEDGGTVTLRTDIPNQIIVTWDEVGFFSQRTDLDASFQLVLRGPDFDVPEGEGDIGFFYNEIEWETGDASGGTDGFGGTPATAGFGDGLSEINPGEVSIPGSQMDGISDVLSDQFFWFDLGEGGIPVDPTPPPPPPTPPSDAFAAELVEILLGEGVSFSNATFTGNEASAGQFTDGIARGIGIEQGVILSTGNIFDAEGPNELDETTTDFGTAGDPDLDAIVAPNSTNDAAVLQFDFVAVEEELNFQYVFASEEYNEFVGSEFNDVFGFFLNGENIALIPGTTTPVAINNVNDGLNSEFYRNNARELGVPTPFDTEFDGFTAAFTAQATVTPGETNTIKLVIADTSDAILDSAVFLAGGSFGGVQDPNLTFAAADFSGIEGTSATVTVVRSGNTIPAIEATIELSDNTATAPDDFDNTPISVSFASGQTIQTVEIPLVNDDLSEGLETVNLLLTDPQNGAVIGAQDEAVLTIEDPSNSPPIVADDAIATTSRTPIAIDVLANDSDIDGDALEIAGFSQPNNGTVSETEDGLLEYTSDPGFIGEDSFTYSVSDGFGGIATGTVAVTVESRFNRILGTPNPDNLAGTVESDLIIALSGDDTLTGGQGADILIGGPGTDILNGGLGQDVLIGSEDGDIFVLPTTSAAPSLSQADNILAFQVDLVDPSGPPIDTIGLTGGLTEEDLILEQTTKVVLGTLRSGTEVRVAETDRVLGFVADEITPDQLIGKFVSIDF